jgi:hypothetical protein
MLVAIEEDVKKIKGRSRKREPPDRDIVLCLTWVCLLFATLGLHQKCTEIPVPVPEQCLYFESGWRLRL